MKYQRTRKAVLQFVIHELAKSPTVFGHVFKKWTIKEIEEDYPLFHWALKEDRTED